MKILGTTSMSEIVESVWGDHETMIDIGLGIVRAEGGAERALLNAGSMPDRDRPVVTPEHPGDYPWIPLAATEEDWDE